MTKPEVIPTDEALRQAVIDNIASAKIMKIINQQKDEVDPIKLCKAIKAANPDWSVHQGKVLRVVKKLCTAPSKAVEAEETLKLADDVSLAIECGFESVDTSDISPKPSVKDAKRAEAKRQKHALKAALTNIGIVEADARDNDWILINHAAVESVS